MHLLYSLLLAPALVVTLPYWLLKMLTSGKYRAGLAERFGRVPDRLRATGANENCIWVHAVSVGEVLAVEKLIAELKRKFDGWRIVVSTTTRTAQDLARSKFGAADVFYLPLDFKLLIWPFLAKLRPRLLVLAESEFWPNLVHLASSRGCRIAVVNARVSDRSFPRYRTFGAVFERLAFRYVDLFLAQSELDRERLLAIGAPPSRVQVSGNLKFEFRPPVDTAIVPRLRAALGGARLAVFGSSVEGEEALLAPTFAALLREVPQPAIILAPRHPERFDAAASAVTAMGLPVVRRSDWHERPLAGKVFLLDSIGELASIYQLADIAFVGGSLVPRGGHNILEPAYFAKPIVVGPHTENFRDIVTRFRAANAIVIADHNSLGETMLDLLRDPAKAQSWGRAARKVLDENSGATEKTLSALEVLLWMPEAVRARMEHAH